MRTSVVASFLLAGAVVAGGGKGKGHPHFDGKGVLPWYTELSAAQAAAKKQDKLVFIEYGREA